MKLWKDMRLSFLQMNSSPKADCPTNQPAWQHQQSRMSPQFQLLPSCPNNWQHPAGFSPPLSGSTPSPLGSVRSSKVYRAFSSIESASVSVGRSTDTRCIDGYATKSECPSYLLQHLCRFLIGPRRSFTKANHHHLPVCNKPPRIIQRKKAIRKKPLNKIWFFYCVPQDHFCYIDDSVKNALLLISKKIRSFLHHFTTKRHNLYANAIVDGGKHDRDKAFQPHGILSQNSSTFHQIINSIKFRHWLQISSPDVPLNHERRLSTFWRDPDIDQSEWPAVDTNQTDEILNHPSCKLYSLYTYFI